jgi:hypothetical protein
VAGVRREFDWAAVAVGALLALAGCGVMAEPLPALTVTIAGETPGGAATLVYTVDSRTDSMTVTLPYARTYRAHLVVVQATVAAGTVGCLIEHGEAPVADDTDPRPTVAACATHVLGRTQ